MEFNLQKYQAFLKTVEYGSFTKAAEVFELFPVRNQPYDFRHRKGMESDPP